jgi:hypothetical protein
MCASVRDAWAEPRMLNAVETSGRVQIWRVLETAEEAWVDVLGHPGKGGEVMCARQARKPGSMGRDDGLESVMPYSARMSRRYLD